jgi:lipopolysaccharide transport protein LptA
MSKTIIIIAILMGGVAAAVSAADTPGNAPGTGAVTSTTSQAGESNAPAKSSLSATGNATNEPTIITADQLHGDYLHNVGTFEGNVLAVDPRMTVRADKMTVFFGTTNLVSSAGTNTTRSVQKIIADGGVVMTTPDNKKTNSDHAEYNATDGKVVLTGHPRAESADGIVTGNKITFWRDSQRMDVENSQTETNRPRLLIYPDEQRKKQDGQ